MTLFSLDHASKSDETRDIYIYISSLESLFGWSACAQYETKRGKWIDELTDNPHSSTPLSMGDGQKHTHRWLHFNTSIAG